MEDILTIISTTKKARSALNKSAWKHQISLYNLGHPPQPHLTILAGSQLLCRALWAEQNATRTATPEMLLFWVEWDWEEVPTPPWLRSHLHIQGEGLLHLQKGRLKSYQRLSTLDFWSITAVFGAFSWPWQVLRCCGDVGAINQQKSGASKDAQKLVPAQIDR